MTIEQIQSLIFDVPDFPKPGITFKDITPLLANHTAFVSLTKRFAELLPNETTHIAAIESRGFILGAALAQHVDKKLVLIRKPGKLPRATESLTYDLEYGSDTLEIHRDDMGAGDKVVIIDDVLATGGTAQAAELLCAKLGAEVIGFQFLMELDFLSGREKLKAPIYSVINY